MPAETAQAPTQNPQFDSLGRSPEALPFWSRYGLPMRVVFPAAHTKRDIAHGLTVVPSGYLVLWSDAPISATPGLNWTPEIAYLQSSMTNARAIVLFVVLRETVTLAAGGPSEPGVVPPTMPTAHAPTHYAGGSDVVDVKLLGGYPGGTSSYLRADGTFAVPVGVWGPGGGTLDEPAWSGLAARLDAIEARLQELEEG